MSQSLKRSKLSDLIRDRVIQMMADGSYKPGDQLPTEKELSETYQVSRSSVREALQALVGLGLVDIRRGQGMYVKNLQAGDLIQPNILGILLSPAHNQQLLEARLVIEPTLATLATERATDEDFLGMDEFLRGYEAALGAGEHVHELSATFHLRMAFLAHNVVLCQFVESLLQVMSVRGGLIDDYPGFKVWEYESHCEVYQAVKSRDAEKSAAVMRSHLLESTKWYLGAVVKTDEQSV